MAMVGPKKGQGRTREGPGKGHGRAREGQWYDQRRAMKGPGKGQGRAREGPKKGQVRTRGEWQGSARDRFLLFNLMVRLIVAELVHWISGPALHLKMCIYNKLLNIILIKNMR